MTSRIEALQLAMIEIMKLHVRAMSCHCECMAMNVGDMQAVVAGVVPPYTDTHYYQIMQKWGLIDDKGEPTKEV